MSEAPAADAAIVYDNLEDTITVAMFLRAIQRLPATRAAALREAVKKLDASSDKGRALQAWFERTRAKSSGERDREARNPA